jgi:hypothetical protein
MRHSATAVHTFELPGGQVVAGSNPVSPTKKMVSDLLFSAAETAIKVQLLFAWDHVFGCEAFFGRTCPMVKWFAGSNPAAVIKAQTVKGALIDSHRMLVVSKPTGEAGA